VRAEALDEEDEGEEAKRNWNDPIDDGRLSDGEASDGAEGSDGARAEWSACDTAGCKWIESDTHEVMETAGVRMPSAMVKPVPKKACENVVGFQRSHTIRRRVNIDATHEHHQRPLCLLHRLVADPIFANLEVSRSDRVASVKVREGSAAA